MDADAETAAGETAAEPGVTGPPPEMAESHGELTPMMSQYYELCADYDDALVLFQVGDFYEAFCDAAAAVSRICEVTLTQREDSTGTYRMAGVPIDDAASYVESLLAAGHRVAIADQVEDPDEVTGVVERAVTRVVTPGTVTDDELLSPGAATYVACLAAGPDPDPAHAVGDDVASVPDLDAGDAPVPDLPPGEYAVALVDVSTGEFTVAGGSWATVREELARFDPAEVVLDPRLRVPELEATPTLTRGAHDPSVFGLERASAALEEHVGPPSLAGDRAELRACGALLAYAEYTQGGADGRLGHVSRLRRYDPGEYLRLDAAATRSLELFETRSTGDGPTLLSSVDETASAPGRRRLTAWLRQPLVDGERIAARHGAVGTLVDAPLVREDLQSALAAAYDLERLTTRVTRGRADARDLRSLHATLAVVPEVLDALDRLDLPDEDDTGTDDETPLLADLRAGLDEMADVRGLVEDAVRPDPPAEITEGGVIREGFDDELDDLRATEREGREWVADLEARERERTGIDSLSVGYNDVHGYYIEVTNPNLDRVPDDYTRRQTLKNSERFYTPELKRREDEILGAAERADARELDLFRDVRASVAAEADRLRGVADRLATLDALVGLATTAVEHDYVRPEMGADGVHVEAGRHPVVERTRSFVPNDTHLDDRPLALITGPNMSGKSTYMRQTALVAVLAQAGGFVPADAARLPVFDGVYTRVGASDDIAGGESTFMREMTELTTILHSATADSLVLLDEVGRGTSTVDGRAIARAVTEYVHDELGAYTLFATHYHELTAAAEDLPRAKTLHFDAERTGDEVTFRYDVREGAASSSYGVEIARMAGVPAPVVDRARAVVDAGPPEDGDHADNGYGDAGSFPDSDDPEHDTVAAPTETGNGHRADDRADDADGGGTADSDPERDPLREDLAAVDVATTTPLEALNLLADLAERAETDDASEGRR